MPAERLQKILAKAGIASRRKAEELISEGLVTVNGKLAKLGEKAEFGKDAIKVNGKLLLKTDSPIYMAFYKPRGVISMLADPEGRPCIIDYLTSVKSRVFPIGRLDFNSEGLLLLTNDGEIAEKIQKSSDVLRIYQVKVKGHPEKEAIDRLAKGAKVDGKLYKPHSVRLAQDLNKKSVIEIVVQGAGAFDVRALVELRGLLFERITRTAIGHMTLRGLTPGKFRYLTQSQMEALVNQPELGARRLESEKSYTPERVMPAGIHKAKIRREEERKVAARQPAIKIGAAKKVIRPVSPDSRADSRGDSRSNSRPGSRPGPRPGARIPRVGAPVRRSRLR
jgi:pseudouridine synthase